MTDIHPDRLYLTSTGRLARDLTRRFRLRSLREGKQGWEPLRALTLNGWLDRTWSESWPEKIPAPDLYRLTLWNELARRIEPPSPLTPDPNLCAILDETFGVMARHNLDPVSGFPSTPLVEWRREISAAFRKSLEAADLFHPSGLPALLRRAITDGKVILPDRIALAGFESPAPVERDLFSAIEKHSDVEYMSPPVREPERIEALALPSPEQEVIFLVHRLVQDALTIPLHRIGVIVPDMDRYAKDLERRLRDVTGTSAPRGTSWFNMTKGVPLLETRLLQAALLPLRFIIEGEPRELLLSLFLSPYYDRWRGKRARIARADIILRKRSVDSGLDNLLRVLKAEDPDTFTSIPQEGIEYLSAFCRTTRISEKKKGAFWAAQLRGVWNHLGFPVGADEKDTVDKRGLDEIMEEIDRHLSEARMDKYEFSAWLSHLASRKVVQIGAAEDAGIQIMGIIESRGLAFDKLYILGMDDRSLPEPVRPLPFLDSTERKLVQGGTAESQYEFARRSFDHLMRIAPDITLLRAEQEDLKPLTPSPFWPEDEEKRSIDIWNVPDRAWLRADWLRRAYEGLHEEISFDLETEKPFDRLCLPETVSVSRLKTAVTCPYRFFAEAILKMEPLEDVEPETSPREKGNRIHRAVALFTHRVRERETEMSSDEARALLTACVDEALQNVAKKPQWEVERRRWIGSADDAEEGGILIEWLDRERKRWLEGWRCVAEEIPFGDLALAGLPFALRGRIDRVDFSKNEGLLLWDYKTGTPSSSADIVKRLKDSQLVIYLMALAEGHIPGLE
ncbi:MAG: PD-(D/E)XK nuclease family protein, partial [Syntrophaceae bacterium]|nr:PD-(D/E)XK nuclease family protein [Syntrophaceae bacterium]